jgi:hypothetical protein
MYLATFTVNNLPRGLGRVSGRGLVILVLGQVSVVLGLDLGSGNVSDHFSERVLDQDLGQVSGHVSYRSSDLGLVSGRVLGHVLDRFSGQDLEHVSGQFLGEAYSYH